MTSLQLLASDLSSMWEPRERPDPLTWAEREIILDPRFSPRPGRYDCSFTPYLKQLHHWFGDRNVRQLTFVKSAQIGGTTLIANLIQYVVAEEPGPVLYVTSTAENAKSWSERELIPRMRSCVALRKLMPDDSDLFKKTEMQFKNCTVKLVGSNSEANLASRPVRFLFCDEVDKWPDSSATEAPALELAMARTNFYKSIAKTVLASTPTVPSGAIWKQYLAGSQHRLHVSCPECSARQWLDFDQLSWSYDLRAHDGNWDFDGVRDSAVYLCKECGIPWDQSAKRALIEEACLSGGWIAGNPNAPKEHISCHVSAMYSPQISWGEMAVLFLQKRKTPGGLHDFYNTYLGLPFEPRASRVQEEKILSLRGDYRQREIPAEACIDQTPILTLCADPGSATRSRTHWTVEARVTTGESWVIDYGVVEEMETLVDENFLRARIYRHPVTGEELRLAAGLVDSGWSAERVYSLCSRSGGLLYPSKGNDSVFRTFSSSSVTGFSTILYAYSDFVWKSHLYLDRIQKGLPPLLHFPSDASREFLSGHSGQALVENKGSRANPWRFKEVENDHYGDCSKLHCVAWAILREKL